MSDSNPDEAFSRFSDFDIIRATYKTVHVSAHEILAHILVPKHLTSQVDNQHEPSPVLVRFHGGGFITGSALFPDWFSPWALELASRHSAVIVSPDYRLIPESSMDEVLEDVEDFWKWLHDELPAFILQKTNGAISVDASRIMAVGDSAGGYLSLQLGLNHRDEIRAVVAAYPMVNTNVSDFTEPRQKSPFGVPHVPISQFEEHRDRVRKGELPSVISADETLQRIPLMHSLIQNGRYPEFLPLEKRHLHILDKLDDGARFPRGGLLVLHGREDSVVPVEGSIALSSKIRQLDPDLNFHLALQPGDHGFDGTAKLDDEWLSEGLVHLVKAWLD